MESLTFTRLFVILISSCFCLSTIVGYSFKANAEISYQRRLAMAQQGKRICYGFQTRYARNHRDSIAAKQASICNQLEAEFNNCQSASVSDVRNFNSFRYQYMLSHCIDGYANYYYYKFWEK